jgi:UDP-N-acetylglucosamine 2-epimerase (non-hydrolysing)
MKVMIVVGARPNFMKAAPVVFAIRAYNGKFAALSSESPATSKENIQLVLVHTGQHYDEAMSGSFFSDLGLPDPDIHLEVGSGSHAVQTAEIMRRFEGVLLERKPDVVVVFGDVNSTVACALVASKISLDSSGTRPLIAHVEAGLRSFDSGMPEEINRVITDHLSDLLFVTEESGKVNLCREGVAPEKIHFVGNTMIDSLLASRQKSEKSAILDQFGLRSQSNGPSAGVSRYALLTLHRPSNVDNRDTFLSILEGLQELSESCPIFFSAHPRTQKRITEFGLEHFFQAGNEGNPAGIAMPVPPSGAIRLLGPLGYLDFLCLMRHAALVVTDSGGIQEETTCLMVPCVTVRENTERPVTVTCGTNTIAGTNTENIRMAVKEQLRGKKHARVPEKWDGKAAGRIVEAIAARFEKGHSAAISGMDPSIVGQTNASRAVGS